MDSKKKIIVFSIIFGVVVLALLSLVMYPLYKGIKKNSEEFITAKKEVVLSEGETGKFEQFKDAYEELGPDLERIEQLFINPEMPIDLIKFWRETAEDSELSMNDPSPVFLKTAETDSWDAMGYQISLTGSFSNFSRFLEKLETAFYLIEIQSLTVKKLKEGGIKEVSATLLVKVYTK